MPFNQPLTNLAAHGEKTLTLFARSGVETLRDLLTHLPLRYEDRSHITPVAALRDGATVQVHGEVLHADLVQRRKRMLLVTLRDAGATTASSFTSTSTPASKKPSPPDGAASFTARRCGRCRATRFTTRKCNGWPMAKHRTYRRNSTPFTPPSKAWGRRAGTS